jgi:hypothetical protein
MCCDTFKNCFKIFWNKLQFPGLTVIIKGRMLRVVWFSEGEEVVRIDGMRHNGLEEVLETLRRVEDKINDLEGLLIAVGNKTLKMEKKIMSKFDDLKVALDGLVAEVGVVATNVQALLDKIANAPPDADVQHLLDEASQALAGLTDVANKAAPPAV